MQTLRGLWRFCMDDKISSDGLFLLGNGAQFVIRICVQVPFEPDLAKGNVVGVAFSLGRFVACVICVRVSHGVGPLVSVELWGFANTFAELRCTQFSPSDP